MPVPPITMLDIIDTLVPNHTLDIYPRIECDMHAIPGSLHCFKSDTLLTPSQVDRFELSDRIPWLAHTPHGIIFQLVASVRTLHLTTAPRRRTRTEYDEAHVAQQYWVEIEYDPIPSDRPVGRARNKEGYIAIGQHILMIASAPDLRTAFIRRDLDFSARTLGMFTALSQASAMGQTTFYPVHYPLPTSLRLLPQGMVLHDTVRGQGPWFCTRGTSKDEAEGALSALVGVDVTLGWGLVPAARKQPGHDLEMNGRMSVNLTHRLETADRMAAAATRVTSLVDIVPVARPEPDPTLAPVPILYILFRSNLGDRERIAPRLFNVVFGVLHDPPPPCQRDLSNVAAICIVDERTSHWDLPFAIRRAVNEFDPNGCVAAPLATHVTRMKHEVAKVQLPGLWTYGADGGWCQWQSQIADLESQVEHAQLLGEKNGFHQGVTAVMEQIIRLHPTRPPTRASFARFMTDKNLVQCWMIVRTSRGDCSGQSAYQASINRQRAIASLLLPAQHFVEEHSHTSINADSSPILGRLRNVRDCLVVFSSLDRAVRSAEGLAQIRRLCAENNVYVAALFWPAADVVQLAPAPGRARNELLDDACTQWLSPTMAVGKLYKSRPTLLPCLVAGPDLPVHLHQVVSARVAATAGFERGFRASAFQSPPVYRLSPRIMDGGDEEERGVSEGCLEDADELIQQLLPGYAGELIYKPYRGRDTVNCKCVVGGCAKECLCMCPLVCKPAYEQQAGIAHASGVRAICSCTAVAH